jgi:hypothetical protein
MIGTGALLFFAIPGIFAAALLSVGLILRLCEWSWQKRAGSMGSTGLFLVSGVFFLPLILYLAWVALAKPY